MDKLYLANCSKQDHIFAFSLKGHQRPYHQKIAAGKQIVVACRDGEAQQIIDQHLVYGMQEAGKVERGFSGIAYRLNKPISLDAIQNGFEQRDAEVDNRALEAQKVSAAATDKLLDDAAERIGARPVGELEIQVTEESKGPADAQAGKRNQTITVAKPGIDRRAGGRRRG